MKYQLLNDPFGNALTDRIIKTSDNGEICTVPNDPENADWRDYQNWLSAGNTPLPPEVAPTAGETSTAASAPTDGNPTPEPSQT